VLGLIEIITTGTDPQTRTPLQWR